MDTTYNIRDFIVNSLPKEKRDEFMGDVNTVLRNVFEAEETGGKEIRTLDLEWDEFHESQRENIRCFADKWYPDASIGNASRAAQFVLRNLFKAKRIGYCVKDGKLF